MHLKQDIFRAEKSFHINETKHSNLFWRRAITSTAITYTAISSTVTMVVMGLSLGPENMPECIYFHNIGEFGNIS
jgi:hypothetical protein